MHKQLNRNWNQSYRALGVRQLHRHSDGQRERERQIDRQRQR